jgi:hypothetical protein
MNIFIIPGKTRMDAPKKELESLLQDKTELKEGDFVFFYDKIRNIMRYFPWKISWIDTETMATGYFPWWPEHGIIHKATKDEYIHLVKVLPLAFVDCCNNTLKISNSKSG